MKSKHILLVILLASTVTAAVAAYLESHGIQQPGGWRMGSMFLFGALVFVWYYFDSNERGFKRSKWLNIAVVALAALAIPYYLVRSRETGHKLRALLRCAGFFVVVVLCSALGAAVGSSIG